MNGFSTSSVVEQMSEELAARRRASVGRRAAYLALARVIASSDEQLERLAPPRLQGSPRRRLESATAA